MTDTHDIPQPIARLTLLREVLNRITDRVKPVAPVQMAIADALGHVAAADVKIGRPVPPKAIALRDGYAVRAEATADASLYAPAPLAGARRIDAGEALPSDTDAVAALDSVVVDAAGIHAVTVTAPGEGVLPAGFDVPRGEPLRLAGTRLRHVDLAALAAIGVEQVAVRTPRVRVACGRDDAALRQIATLVERLVAAAGGELLPPGCSDLADALGDRDAQLVAVVGGSGHGRGDNSIKVLAQAGRVDVHGVAISPGHTTALGAVGDVPVLVLTGRVDAALAAWLTIGVPLMRRLTGAIEERPIVLVPLTRKVTSVVGSQDVVPVHVSEGRAQPLALGALPLHALVEANGYILVPAESEGYPEGAVVGVRFIP